MDNEQTSEQSTDETPAPAEMNPIEEAAMRFTKLLPFVPKLADALPSKGAVVRVLYALAQFPLGAEKPRLLNDAERQLFHVMMELQGFKTKVVSNIIENNAKAQKEAEALKQAAETMASTAETDVINE